MHRTHLKKTGFFEPKPFQKKHSMNKYENQGHARFFDDHEHMLSVIGLIRFAMGIPDNIVMANDSYEVKELKIDYTRTIQRSLLTHKIDKETQELLISNEKIMQQIPFDRHKETDKTLLLD